MSDYTNIVRQTRIAGMEVTLHRHPVGGYVLVAKCQGREVRRDTYQSVQEAIVAFATVGRYVK